MQNWLQLSLFPCIHVTLQNDLSLLSLKDGVCFPIIEYGMDWLCDLLWTTECGQSNEAPAQTSGLKWLCLLLINLLGPCDCHVNKPRLTYCRMGGHMEQNWLIPARLILVQNATDTQPMNKPVQISEKLPTSLQMHEWVHPQPEEPFRWLTTPWATINGHSFNSLSFQRVFIK